MALSDEQIEEFRRLYKARYGCEISREKAYEQGIKLMRFLKRIYRQMTEKQFNTIQQRRAETFPQMLTHLALHEKEDSV